MYIRQTSGKYHSAIAGAIMIAVFLLLGTVAAAAQALQRRINRPLANPSLVDAFYRQRQGHLFWLDSTAAADDTPQQELVRIIKEEAPLQGLDALKYLSMLPAVTGDPEPGERLVYDRRFTDAALAYFGDLCAGDPRSRTRVGSDEISGKYEEIDRRHIISLLNGINNSMLLRATVAELEPSQPLYRALKEELQKQLELGDREKIASLMISLNNYRWFFHFGFKHFVVVNIAAAELNYFEQDSVKLNMRIVAGKPSTMTPRFVTYCDQVILYPYWNVPRSIAVNEILPFCKKSLVVLDILRMQVISSKGVVVDPKQLDWKKFTAKNFPYRFRQSTGCDNALGVIKFNLSSPYSVYLHDTNLKSDFEAAKRYFSHGCIRIQKPLELANELLDEKLDEQFLTASIRGQQPIPKRIAKPVPVFVLYMTADATVAGAVRYFQDVYDLL
ncbi:L,D-transpeptidase family protein [Niabella drilacis]|uniref:L,D-transpeptidase catalytic domain n=1 Tax=Niabella drilacis (strain DSM 25811 / CCM 8410 / CCUG 62505 / LMG 26954 / E90) TaxID=1285928 RepID=A0A1G6REK9_NIADE|nr:L,D-transpeptidase family protein [Niabella drilacis]SDD02813.1 L,D-transpeptidase catalytic domain [Niabella drilacis]